MIIIEMSMELYDKYIRKNLENYEYVRNYDFVRNEYMEKQIYDVNSNEYEGIAAYLIFE